MPTYTIWTIGCQMNKAESQQIADSLGMLGYDFTPAIQKADLIILNTCVVRRSAEDKVLGMLGYLEGIKKDNPDAVIIVTGCFVDSKIKQLEKRFPHVSFFYKPGTYQELVQWLRQKKITEHEPTKKTCKKYHVDPIGFVPIIQGCNNYCSYCIVPYRRGTERSRPQEEIIAEVKSLVNKGIKEVTLFGQNVNSYGNDLRDNSNLSNLLRILNDIDGLLRIRFLTNHPKDMSLRLIETITCLDKVCEHLNVPLQSGDDAILNAMKRGYSIEQYCNLVNTIRSNIPGIALSTDIIVGFPGETDEQFQRTLNVIQEIRFDTVHIAAYSPREGTFASREFDDNVSPETKKERVEKVEAIQTQIATEINLQFQDKKVAILVEGEKRGKWYGRTRNSKLVFFEGKGDYLGKLVDVFIAKTSPWALQGRVENR
jgi:tRNA-2-methylthio-N6-dimethylallyladenosine synthase